MILFSDPLFLEHETGRHVETPARLRAITARLQQSGIAERCRRGAIASLPLDAVRRLHGEEMIVRAEQAAARGGMLDADTVVSPRSFEVALAAAGTCAAAVDAVMAGPDKRALCLVRPPGHHATPTHSMGFCLFNSIALAADHARAAHGLSRILIVDWDVHHGNGTQDIFYADPAVMFLSIHRFGHGFYPGTGGKDETGSGAGLGYTRNVPVRFGTARSHFLDLFGQAVEQAAEQMKPELLLLSAGFDAHALDPIGSLGLEVEDFVAMTSFLKDVAAVHCAGRFVSCLEGGYNLEALADCVAAHAEELLR